ncbi:MAG: rhomboid family intramembrane serine protease [Phycisphaerae bacterium]|nr:rhomboid family intramembrane serine protease [Phycisphaerales bacterium]
MMLPYEADVAMQRYPWANVLLITATCFISLAAIADSNVFDKLALGQRHIPKYVLDFPILNDVPNHTRHYPVTYQSSGYFTYGFVHGGIVHLAGNMLFLFVFGNAVNAKIGHIRYLVIYFLLLAASAAIQVRYIPIPLRICGASGAIYGIMGMFIVLYPRNEITCFWFSFYRMSEHSGTFEISSIWIVLYWVAFDVLMLKLELAGNVGIHAHLAGFTIGVLITIAAILMRLIKSDDCEENLLEAVGLMGQWQEVK